MDGFAPGLRVGPPAVGQDTDEVFADLGERRAGAAGSPDCGAPLAGLRVADFGIGGVGVEVGRMLAEYGAEVLKVESRSYPDFIRLAPAARCRRRSPPRAARSSASAPTRSSLTATAC